MCEIARCKRSWLVATRHSCFAHYDVLKLHALLDIRTMVTRSGVALQAL